MSDALLEIRNLSVSFDTDEGRIRAVDDVSLEIRKGEVLGLVGESGCGKSVTAMSTLRLIPSPPGIIESGQILYNNVDMLQMPIKQLRQLRGNDISMIFQEPMTALSPLHRVGHQLVEALRVHRDLDKKEAWQIGTEWLDKVGIPDADERMYNYPFQFSGGMRQRAMIAMALMLEPALIIADEPTTALDVTIQAQIFDLILNMKSRDTSLLLITHDMGVIWEMCDRVVVMYAAKVVEEGPIHKIFQTPKHPYTESLLKSVPRLHHKCDRLETIEGQVPSPEEYPVGCRFRERCPYGWDRCGSASPPLFQLDADQQAACYLYQDGGDMPVHPKKGTAAKTEEAES
ncbi:MAG: ABC transporter ATP-binding protein [Lentisphaeria bacterium]